VSRSKKPPSALRVLCGELEDASVFMERVEIIELRTRLEAAVEESEREMKNLQDAMRGMETQMLVDSNIKTTKAFYGQGLSRAKSALQKGNVDLALEIIDAAFLFHPMHAESWVGWPEERPA